MQIAFSFFDPEESNWYIVIVREAGQQNVSNKAINPEAFTALFKDSKFSVKVMKEQFWVTGNDYSPDDTIAVSLSGIIKNYYSKKFNRNLFLELP